jgi:hypothetical protein
MERTGTTTVLLNEGSSFTEWRPLLVGGRGGRLLLFFSRFSFAWIPVLTEKSEFILSHVNIGVVYI